MLRFDLAGVKNLVLVFGLSIVSATAIAEEPKCVGTNARVEASTSTARFEINGELVKDLVTGLTWARCPLGYSMDTTVGCVAISGATLTYSWKDAITKSVDPAGDNTGSYLGKTGWRVPNIKELTSIIEHGCQSPSVNRLVFPNTPVGAYWTNSPISVSQKSLSAWMVDFGYGKADVVDASYISVGKTTDGTPILAPNTTLYVRLVRNSD